MKSLSNETCLTFSVLLMRLGLVAYILLFIASNLAFRLFSNSVKPLWVTVFVVASVGYLLDTLHFLGYILPPLLESLYSFLHILWYLNACFVLSMARAIWMSSPAKNIEQSLRGMMSTASALSLNLSGSYLRSIFSWWVSLFHIKDLRWILKWLINSMLFKMTVLSIY